jgi:hypothetical protein
MSMSEANKKEEVCLTGIAFGDMTIAQKFFFVIKAVIMVCTGGFIFPNVFVE